MFDDLRIFESKLTQAEIAIDALNKSPSLSPKEATDALNNAISVLYRVEFSAYREQLNLDWLTGEQSWMTTRINKSNSMIVQLLIAQHKAGLESPSFVIQTECTNERFTIESHTGRTGILRRDFSSYLDSWSTHDILETQELSYRITKANVIFN